VLAFTAASSKTDQVAIADIFAEHGRDGFAAAWLRHKGLDWAAELLTAKPDQDQEPIEAAKEVAP
jgi:type IV secretion system protein VirB4